MIHTASCEHFDGQKFLSILIRENHGSRVPRTLWDHFRFFGGLKNPFLPCCVTQSSWDQSFFWVHFRHLGAFKCYVPGRGSYDSNLPTLLWDHFLHFGGPKMLFQASRGTHGSRAPRFVWANFLQFGVFKRRFLTSREITNKWYVAYRELIFGILAAWKSLFLHLGFKIPRLRDFLRFGCRVAKPMVQV